MSGAGSLQDRNRSRHDMRVLVTGADGFIGSAVMESFRQLAPRANVVALDTSCDIRDYDAVTQQMKQHHPDVVVHLAAVSGAMLFVDRPDIVVASNAVGTVNVLEAAHQAHASRVMYASSVATFECPPRTTQPPRSLYGATKAFGETLAELYRRKGLLVCSLRIGAVYGAQRQTSDTLSEMIAQWRDTGNIHFDPHGVEPFIEIRDAGNLLAAATFLERPRDGYDVVGYAVTHGRLAHELGARLSCHVRPDEQHHASSWARPFDTWSLLADTGQSLHVGFDEGLSAYVEAVTSTAPRPWT